MGYSDIEHRHSYQQCDNCIFIRSCFLQELHRLQENMGQGNECFFYQDERDLPPNQRTTRYLKVKDLPPYDVRIRRPAAV